RSSLRPNKSHKATFGPRLDVGQTWLIQSSPKLPQASSGHVWTTFPTCAKRDSIESWSISSSKPRLGNLAGLPSSPRPCHAQNFALAGGEFETLQGFRASPIQTILKSSSALSDRWVDRLVAKTA
ncbi:hypothetical protein PIB30_056526, partial [Stylosanthes scabra]|nr:hypothetical protein [Stylosanthes scabra]